ncbi:MAG: hypothetical protein ACE5K0_00380 [Candidatus Methanofastidiosia archaeon]
MLEIDNIMLEIKNIKLEKNNRGERMKSRTLNRLWIAVTAVVVVIAVIAFWSKLGWESHALLPSVILGIVIANLFVFSWVLWKRMQEKKAGFPTKDERTMYIEGCAGHYTVMIGLWFMLGLMWYIFLGMEVFGWPELKALPALIISILVTAILNLGLRWYFGRKG